MTSSLMNRIKSSALTLVLALSFGFLSKVADAQTQCWDASNSQAVPGKGCADNDRENIYSCNNGYYNYGIEGNGGSQIACQPCPEGYECTTSSYSQCGSGTYSLLGSNSCQTCGAGSKCDHGGHQPQVCPKGTKSDSGNNDCASTPAGSYSSAGTQQTVTGNAWSPQNSAYAYALAAWEYSTDVSTPPTRCMDGQYNNNYGGCVDSAAGEMVPDPADSAYTACPVGTYTTVARQTACAICPPGYECTNQNTIGLCDDGYFNVGGQSDCSICPAGYNCLDRAAPPVICDPGTGSNSGDSQCDVAADGTEILTMGNATPTSCSTSGQYSVRREKGDPHACQDCQRGYTCPSNNALPTVCLTGTFTDSKTDADGCNSCDEDFMCPATDAPAYACPYGHHTSSYNNEGGATDQTGCRKYSSEVECTTTQDNAQYAWPNPGVCVTCPEGFMCPHRDMQPVPCPPGFYSAAGAVQCTECEAGYMCPTPYSGSGSDRKACDDGWYADRQSVNCYPSPPGMNNASVDVRPTWCSRLEQSATATSTCATCGVDMECEEHNLGQIACESGGSGTHGAGNTNEAKSYAGEKRCYPLLGIEGTHSGADAQNDQTAVAAGINSLQVVTPGAFGFKGFNTEFDCPAGHQCMFPYQQVWSECPPGYYSQPNRFICEPCPEHHFCNNRQDTATPVQNGFWSPLGTHIQMVSPAGWYAKQEVSGSATDAADRTFRPCAIGYYSGDFATECTICPADRHCEHASSVPLRCPEGREATSAGTAICDHCEKNEYVNPGDLQCRPIEKSGWALHPMYDFNWCMAGTYSEPTVLDMYPRCLGCTPGYLCLTGTGTDFASFSGNDVVNGVAPPGHWSNPNTHNSGRYLAYACPSGTDGAVLGVSALGETQDQCMQCEAGSYCEGGVTGEVACQLGFMCPALAVGLGTHYATQYPVLPGFVQASMSDLTNMAQVPAGSFALVGSGGSTQVIIGLTSCPPGYVCPANVLDPYREPCAGGTYQANVSLNTDQGTACQACEAGYYCPPGSVYPQKCPAGTFTSATDAVYAWECEDTAAGLYQSQQGKPTSGGTTCIIGYLCPGRTSYSNQFPCPPGTFGTSDRDTRFEDCAPCTAGKACPQGTGDEADTATICEPGFYCEQGSLNPRQFPCAGGTYNPRWGSTSNSACDQCNAGYYCPVGSYRQYDCPTGYYCDAGTANYYDTPCAAGTYGAKNTGTDSTWRFHEPFSGNKPLSTRLAASSECDACPGGYYCQNNHEADPQPCPKGTFCTGGCHEASDDNGNSASCTSCTEGYMCPFEGMTDAIICPAGYWSPLSSQECFVCALGRQCDEAGRTGTDYESDAFRAVGYETSLVNAIATGSTLEKQLTIVCPEGYYCPAGSFGYTDFSHSNAIPCPIGTYGAAHDPAAPVGLTQLSECTNVNSGDGGGHYADTPGTNSTMYLQQWCAPGYKCPDNTACTTRYCVACADGYYTDIEGSAECTICTAGYYCPGATPVVRTIDVSSSNTRSTFRPILCPAGFYCEEGDTYPSLCDVGSYGAKAGLIAISECTPCPAGNYCIEPGALAPTGLCDAGFICVAGAATPRPYGLGVDAVTSVADGTCVDGDAGCVCPAGGYCEIGSVAQKACKGGYYNPYVGKKTVYDCTKCPPGYYCAGEARSEPNGKCTAGYYCIISDEEGGSSVADQYPVPPGYYTWSDDADDTKTPAQSISCPIGTYNNYWHRGNCEPCTPGYYCPTSAIADTMTPCPMGAWCSSPKVTLDSGGADTGEGGCEPAIAGVICGSWVFELCPAGTYNPNTHQATEAAACLQCPPGKYCQTSGSYFPSGDCAQGYFCVEGASLRSPPLDELKLGRRFGPCPAGHYCPTGTAYPFPCPKGTFNAGTTGQSEAGACEKCTAGKYCETTGLTTPTGDCQRGFVCYTGTYNKAPMAMTAEQITDLSFTLETVCPKGSYCPEGSSTILACPMGQYQPNDGGWECWPCPNGYYCYTDAGTGVYGTIEPILCPAGRSCAQVTGVGEGNFEGQACASGTYQPEKGQDSCVSCDAGYYCADPGTTFPTTQCDAGYYCRKDNSNGAPTLPSKGGSCTVGQYCDQGSAHPKACEPGYACPVATSDISSRVLCTLGYYCMGGTTTATPYDTALDKGSECPAGHYCPQFTTGADGVPADIGSKTPIPCPPGTYNGLTQQDTADDCLACPDTEFCEAYGSTTGTSCSDGWYCIGSETEPTPIGQVCPVGFYCIGGQATPCADGSYQDQIGQTGCKTCPAGYQCRTVGATTLTFINAVSGDTAVTQGADTLEVCGFNAYCPINQNTRTYCDNGEYTAFKLSEDATSCLECAAGMTCGCTDHTDDLCNQFFTPCTAGKYCPVLSYDESTAPVISCGAGYFCPERSPSRIPCRPGRACHGTEATGDDDATNVDDCNAGTFCTGGNDNIVGADCALGNFCLAGSSAPTPCYLGTYNGPYTNDLGVTESAGDANGVDDTVCLACPSGQSCNVRGTVEPEAPTGCAAGYYCNDGGPKACPAGHFCNTENNNEEASPITCGDVTNGGTSGKYNPMVLQSECDWCPAGFYCPGPDNCPTDPDVVTAYPEAVDCNYNVAIPCPVGYYCPAQTEMYSAQCAQGYYSDFEGNDAAYRCLQCQEGYLCDEMGITSMTPIADVTEHLCPEGFYCPAGSSTELSCTQGNFCPTGSAYMKECPVGTYNDAAESIDDTACEPCPVNRYCAKRGMILANASNCGDGYQCLAGAKSSTPYEAPEGNLCLPGKLCSRLNGAGPEDCPDQYYNPDEGRSTCLFCPGGRLCVGTDWEAADTDGNTKTTPQECSRGFYCPEKTASTVPANAEVICAAGSYSYNLNVMSQDECIPCSIGKYCSGDSTDPAWIEGQAGVVAWEGSVCTAGYYCTKGSAFPEGTAEENIDPVTLLSTGVLIEYVIGTDTGGICTSGFYCKEGTLAPEPCPIGTFGLTNGYTGVGQIWDGSIAFERKCDKCKGGYYCDEVGLNEGRLETKLKKCDPGHWCAVDYNIIPNPDTTGDATMDADWQGGCYPGKWQDDLQTVVIYATNCPVDTTGDLCPPGHQCPKGTETPVLCDAGAYEPRVGSDECQVCPAGYYCTGADPYDNVGTAEEDTSAITPIICGLGYCPAGSSAPTLCPDGYYATDETTRMASADECLYCPHSNYCTDGIKQGICDAGYFCDYGASLRADPSKLCAIGHYCPAGTDYPIRCPEGLYNAIVGATDSSYCTDCLPGWFCMKNDSVMRICPKGHFCPVMSIYPTPCFKGTYNSEKGVSTSDDCLNCPVGSFCDDIAIDDYLRYPCPVGHYCDVEKMKKDPIKCPSGTYRNATGAYDSGIYENYLDDQVGNTTWVNWSPEGRDEPCRNCSAGTYCPVGSMYSTPCEAGYTCPNQTGQPYACEPGTFCPAMSGETATICPQGYYCAFYRTDVYEKCGNGTYCDEGQRETTACPAGYFGSGRTDNYDQDLGCIGCGRGTYSSERTDSCEPCAEGYTCEAYATTDKPTTLAQGGKICPHGFYCPKGSYSAIACPVGHYNDKEGMGSLNQCIPCPSNSFNQFVGGTECFQCLGSTLSQGATATCKCKGLNRKYLAEKGACVCQTGYEPTDGTAEDVDGFADCEKIVYDRCEPTEVRDTTGACRALDDCANECDGGPGSFDLQFGVCECDGLTDVEALVTRAELDRRPQLSFRSDGVMDIYDPVSNDTYSVRPDEMPNVAGTASCSLPNPSDCKIVPVTMLSGDNGNFGSDMNPCPSSLPDADYRRCTRNQQSTSRRYGGTRTYIRDGESSTAPIRTPVDVTPQEPEDNLSDWGWDMGWNIAEDQGRNQRRLQEDIDADPNAGYITNPIVCINLGSALLFEGLGPGQYPIFDKDNLLNQNGDSFDQGEFDKLAVTLADGTVDSFIFTFQQPGLFVFVDSRNPAKQMVIAVMGDQKSCPDDLSFSPMNYASLLKVDAFRREVLEPPDWGFFFGVIMSFAGLIIVTVLIVGYMFKRDWNQKWIPKVAYQNFNYEKAQNKNKLDKNALVSIHTEAQSFLVRSGGGDIEAEEAQEEGFDAILDADEGDAMFAARKATKKKLKKTNLTLRDVEGLKDDLGTHLKEIKKLFRTERDFDESEDEHNLDNSEEDSSDAEYDKDLNIRIANVKQRLMHNAKMIKGEGEDDGGDMAGDYGIGEISGVGAEDADDKDQTGEDNARLQARLEADARARDKLRDELMESEGKYLNDLQLRQKDVNEDLERKRDRVLEMQVENAYGRGQNFQDRLAKDGAHGDDLKNIMDELEAKMGHVEGILMSDQDRQTEQLRKRLEMRAKRRRKMQNRLEHEHDRVQELQHEREDLKAEKRLDIETELKHDLVAMEQELQKEQEGLDQQFLVKKADKMAEYQDRLKGADGKDQFNTILEEYQRAQVGVDRELEKQKGKEADRLEQALLARKAKRRAQAQMKMKEEGQKIDSQVDAEAAEHVENKAKIEASLRQNEEAGEKYGEYAEQLNNRLEHSSTIHAEMERKRREEERLESIHTREREAAEAEASKDINKHDAEVEAEIKKLSNLSTYDKFQEEVSKRDALQKQINGASSEDEKAALLKKLQEVDQAVKDNLTLDAKDQDTKLNARLDARRKKKEAALAQKTELRKEQLDVRIKKSLENSEDYAQKRKDKSMKEIERLIREMQDKVPASEIPAAVERMIDDRHQHELEDLLLKLYEQKAIQLKEEILGVMEEKFEKSQMIRKQADDRKRGIDAIISRTPDKKVTTDMIAKKQKIDEDVKKAIADLENEYRKKEGQVQRDVQAKTMDREAEQIGITQERQIEEKQEIFTKFLPDQMMTDIYDSMAAEERDELQAYQSDLAKEKETKIAQMEAAEADHEKMLTAASSDLERMKRLDKQAQQREKAGQKYKTTMRKREEAQAQSIDVVKQVKERYEKDLAGLSQAHEKEREAFLDDLKNQMESRKQKVADHKKAKAEEASRVAKEKADADERHYIEVRELRAKRAEIEKILEDRQKTIYKGMYSRQEPRWAPYNAVLHAAVEDSGDFNFDEKDKKKFQKTIYNELLEKITAIESQLYLDTQKLDEAARVQELQRQREEALDGGSQYSGMTRQYSQAMSRAGSRAGASAYGGLGNRMGSIASIAGVAPSRQASRASNLGRRASLIKGLKARLGKAQF